MLVVCFLYIHTEQDTSNSTCEVNVESTSETTVRMSWRPGQIGHLIKLYTEVRECADVEFSNCKLFRKFHAKEVSNFTDTNFTVDGLQPNTRYKIAIEVFNVENKKLVFNNTFAIKTREGLYPQLKTVSLCKYKHSYRKDIVTSCTQKLLI